MKVLWPSYLCLSFSKHLMQADVLVVFLSFCFFGCLVWRQILSACLAELTTHVWVSNLHLSLSPQWLSSLHSWTG